MYKSTDYEHEQLSFINFNMACGMQLDMNNGWIRIAQQLPWKAWEALYVAIFPSNTGNVEKPCRDIAELKPPYPALYHFTPETNVEGITAEGLLSTMEKYGCQIGQNPGGP